ncbi:MAG: hypothetical protein PHP57_13455 [Sideroxydans sp.]|nr:hypothetical protein [Sideroxydans sp.]
MGNYDPLDLDAQQKAKREKEVADKLSRESEEYDIKWLMSSKRGRRILWRTLDRAGVFRLSFNTNAMQMAFAEGNRNEGLRTLTMIHSQAPELYPVMVKENTNDNRNTDD